MAKSMSFLERCYLINISNAVITTFFRVFKNFFLHQLKFFKHPDRSNLVVVQYPDERREYAKRYRGRHRLLLRADYSVKCEACLLCATVCPARAIHIEAVCGGEREKFPERFEIDTLRCCYCGMCVEACPIDALRMDYGVHPEVYGKNVNDYIEDKECLVDRTKELLVGDDVYAKHMKAMQDLEF